MSHYRITVVEVLSTTYEVWADTKEEAMKIAEIDTDVAHPKRHECDQDVHPPKCVGVDIVDRKFEC